MDASIWIVLIRESPAAVALMTMKAPSPAGMDAENPVTEQVVTSPIATIPV
jgi:hypothetical protein